MRKSATIVCSVLLALQLVTLPACAGENHDEASEKTEATAITEDADSSHEVPIPATERFVRLIGRTCTDDGVTWLPQSGSAIEFTFSGSHLAIQMTADDNANNEESLCPRFAVLVNDEVVLDDTMSSKTRTVEIFSDESEKDVTVKVIHLSEALYGAVGVRAITVESNKPDPVTPTAAKDLSIGFIGDSITCAYGVEAANSGEPFTTTKENFMKSYAYLAAKELDADYETVCYSGYGIVSGWSKDGTRNTNMLIPPLYGVVAKDYDVPWNLESHPHDVVVINLGTNDSTYTGDDKDRMKEFGAGYGEFLAHVRECNPKSLIVCTIGTMGADQLYPYIEQAVKDFKAKTKDDRVVCYLSKQIDEKNDGVGTAGHPNAVSQQKSADALVEVIRKELPVPKE